MFDDFKLKKAIKTEKKANKITPAVLIITTNYRGNPSYIVNPVGLRLDPPVSSRDSHVSVIMDPRESTFDPLWIHVTPWGGTRKISN